MRTQTACTTYYDVGIYCRLSKEDKKTKNLESMSITNQRDYLVGYVLEQGWNIRDIYIDDGFSGTQFDRPDFQRMIDDIESNKINCVIMKDLSRLGRNYTKSGYYTDEYFLERGIRYIAVNDSVDTSDADGNDVMPFKHILNEMYAKDISKKIRSAYLTCAKQGKFTGSYAPYEHDEGMEKTSKHNRQFRKAAKGEVSK